MATCRSTSGYQYEGWGPVSSLRSFDLTPCFEEGIVLSTLLVILLLAAASRIWVFSSLSTKPLTPRSALVLNIKLALIGFAFLASFTNLGILLFKYVSVPILRSYVLETVSLLVILFLVYTNHTRTRTSSSVVLLFWPFYLLALLLWGRTLLLIHPHASRVKALFILRCVVAGTGLVSFALELIAPKFELSLEDDEGFDEGHVPNPILTANVFSRWTFSYMTSLMKKGASTTITDADLPSLVKSDRAIELASRLQNAMSNHKSLYISLFVAYGGPYAFAALLKIICDCFSFLQPQLLRWLLFFITHYKQNPSLDGPSPYEGFLIAVLMFVSSITQSLILHQYFQLCFQTGLRVRAGLVTTIYQKALRLSNDGQGQSTGEIVSLMSVDSTRLQDFCTYGLVMISGTFQIVLAFVSLYDLLGWSAFVGVGIMVLSVPLTTFIARILKKMQMTQMKNRDRRTKLMSELLSNIKSIKLYAWDYAFLRRVLHARNDEELKMLRKIGIMTSLNQGLWTGIPLLVAFSSFAVAAYFSPKPLTADVIFPSISLFGLLQFPLAMVAQVTSSIIEAMVSVGRLSTFFQADELQSDARSVAVKRNLQDGDEVLSISDGDFSWSRTVQAPTLQDINISVKKGELVAVLGRVGAGKTSLLSAIIGGMRRSDGKVMVHGSISYAPQNPWIMSGTIRDNILFSHEYEETFYNLVLDACALRPDLALLSDSDLTEVGENGITLSGGQRARVALARAVYVRADLVLLDDVLAAVDAHVARHIFDQVIGPSGLLATKARILVTNGISFLHDCDNIILLRHGIILESGTFSSVMSHNKGEIQKLVRDHSGNHTSSETSTLGGSSTPQEDEVTLNLVLRSDSREGVETAIEKLKRRHSHAKAKIVNPSPGRLAISDGIQKEHSEKGRVKSSVYRRYMEASSKSGFALFVFAIVLSQVCLILGNFSLRAWSDNNRISGGNNGITRFLALYGVFSLSSVLSMSSASAILLILCSLRSSKNLHDSMLNSLMHAPLSFFEMTPSGRILNVFSRDIYAVDQVLAGVIGMMFRTGTICIGIIVVVAIIFPIFLVVIPPLAIFYRQVMLYYLGTSRELKRMDAVARSPVFAWFSESLNGLSTIRAFGQQSIFIANHRKRVDANQICYLPSVSVNRWLAVRLEFVGTCIIFMVSLLSMAALLTTGVDAALVGLVLSYALNTTSSLSWVVRTASEVEQNIVSVERILHYVELSPEAPYEIPETEPHDWPSSGEIKFQNYSTRYRPELDLVLKDINISINGREKIGVCGRTGSGKSSLLLALFRILESAEGEITIDGVDVSKIGLHDLRSAISIVPQSPDLFEGTLRENIDPVGTYQDVDIWTALSQVHLKEFVEELPGGLDAAVKEGGSSLSAGQRQLLCFARALLRKTKILVLDEATSAVDLDTDKAIQDIIQGPEFADVTMLTIAHRLNTIMDSDRILLLDAGKVAEFDHPKVLLSRKDSKFYSLAVEAGLA